MFDDKSDKGLPVSTPGILLHDGLLYVGGTGEPGVIWAIDAKTLTLKTRIKKAGKWGTGISFSSVSDRIYAANGNGEILVVDERRGKVIKRFNAGDSMGVKFNGKRHEIDISQRDPKKVLQPDGTTCEVKHSWSVDRHPNSLLVSSDGQTRFVTLKQGFNDDHRCQRLDGMAHIALQ